MTGTVQVPGRFCGGSERETEVEIFRKLHWIQLAILKQREVPDWDLSFRHDTNTNFRTKLHLKCKSRVSRDGA